MTVFTPDLSQYWLAERAANGNVAVAPRRDDEHAAVALRQQFEALVERVNAARSIF